jgi:hypothetical protein
VSRQRPYDGLIPHTRGPPTVYRIKKLKKKRPRSNKGLQSHTNETSSKRYLKHLGAEKTESVNIYFLEFDLPNMNLLNVEFIDDFLGDGDESMG